MALKAHIKRLQGKYPDERIEIIHLACFLNDDIVLTKKYAAAILCCNDYAKIAQNVVREMYIHCQIDETTARKESTFLRYLLDLSDYGVQGNPHTFRYHIDKVLYDPVVREKRKENESKTRNIETTAGQTTAAVKVCDDDTASLEEVTIVVSPQYREVVVPIIRSMEQSGAITIKPKTGVQKTSGINKPIQVVLEGQHDKVLDSIKKLKRDTAILGCAVPRRKSAYGATLRRRSLLAVSGIRIVLPSENLGNSRRPFYSLDQGIKRMELRFPINYNLG